MISSSIHSKFNTDLYPIRIKEAIEFLRNTDFNILSPGEYEIQGRDTYFQVIDMKTKPLELGRPEVHKKYIDIQFLVSGKEAIGFKDDDGENQIEEDLLGTRDLLFYKDVNNLSIKVMNEGDFCVFFPCDVHVPGCEYEGVSDIRKVVYKLKYDLLEKE